MKRKKFGLNPLNFLSACTELTFQPLLCCHGTYAIVSFCTSREERADLRKEPRQGFPAKFSVNISRQMASMELRKIVAPPGLLSRQLGGRAFHRDSGGWGWGYIGMSYTVVKLLKRPTDLKYKFCNANRPPMRRCLVEPWLIKVWIWLVQP